MPLTDDLLAAILFDVAKPHKYVAPQERGAIPLLIGQYRCLEQLDKADGISQQELADRAGLTRQHIGKIEKGELVNVAYVTIQQIAEAIGMTVDIIDPALADLAPLKRLTP